MVIPLTPPPPPHCQNGFAGAVGVDYGAVVAEPHRRELQNLRKNRKFLHRCFPTWKSRPSGVMTCLGEVLVEGMRGRRMGRRTLRILELEGVGVS